MRFNRCRDPALRGPVQGVFRMAAVVCAAVVAAEVLSGLHVDLEALLGRKVHVTTLPDQPTSERERRIAERIKREALPL